LSSDILPHITPQTSSNTIAAAIGGTLGGILLLLAIVYLIYYLLRRNQRRTQHLLQNVQRSTAVAARTGTGNEPTRAMSVEKQNPFDDIENGPPPLTYRDPYHHRGTSSSSVPRDSRQFERSISPQFDIGHLSPTPLALPQHHPTATTTTTNTPSSSPTTTTHPNLSPNNTTSAQEEAELIRHLYTLNIPTAEIAQLVEGMRAERERLSDQKLRDDRAGAGAGTGSRNSTGGADVQSTRGGEQGPPPRYDFKSQ
jgi:hypothetical protein